MKISFQFENGSSLLVLTPENSRDKTYIDLCVDGKSDIRIKPMTADGIALEFRACDMIKMSPTLNFDVATDDI